MTPYTIQLSDREQQRLTLLSEQQGMSPEQLLLKAWETFSVTTDAQEDVDWSLILQQAESLRNEPEESVWNMV